MEQVTHPDPAAEQDVWAIPTRDVIEGLKKRPELWAALSHRRYNNVPNSHIDPQKFLYAAAIHMASLEQVARTEDASMYEHLAIDIPIFHECSKYDYPRYMVGAELLEEFKNTALPPDMTFDNLAWPFPGVMFLLPKGALVRSEGGGSAVAISICRVEQDASSCVPGLLYEIVGTKESRVCCTILTDFGLVYRSKFSIHETFGNVYNKDIQGTPVEKTFTGRAVELALQLLMAMDDEPGLIEKQHLLKRTAISNGNGGKVTYWSPAWVGRTYKYQTEGHSCGSHASPRAHWRRGHWRWQPFGPGRLEYKMIRIKPVRVMGLLGVA